MLKITLCLLVAAVCCSGAEEEEQSRFYFLGHEFDRTKLGDAVDRASMKMLKEVYNDQSDKNVVASPLGVLVLLSMYSSGTTGEEREEIVRALGAADHNEMSNNYSNLNRRFSYMNSDFLTLANKVYISKDLTLDARFTRIVSSDYNSEVENINFGDPKAAADTINQWADQKSKGHIKDPVSEDTLKDDVAAALFNIIFFQGHWNVPFNASETEDKDFHVDKTTTVKKPTMHLEQPMFMADSKELNAKLIELPYKERGFRMVIVLPNEIDGLPSLLNKVAENGVLKDVFSIAPTGQEVLLDVPKFEVKTKLDLKEILPKIGVSRIFTDPAIGIVKEVPVVVSKAFQEAFIKVDEEGATAGAFTGIIPVPSSLDFEPPPPIEIKIDHPFLYVILHEDITLFTGMIPVPVSMNSKPPPPLEIKIDHPFLFVILHEDITLFTGAVMVPMSLPSIPPPPIEFKVDHPFLYLILHEDIALFAGTYTQ